MKRPHKCDLLKQYLSCIARLRSLGDTRSQFTCQLVQKCNPQDEDNCLIDRSNLMVRGGLHNVPIVGADTTAQEQMLNSEL